MPHHPGGAATGPGRRSVLLAGVTAGGAALAGCSAPTEAEPGSTPTSSTARGATTVARAFHGTHQAGILEPAQPYAVFLGLDLPAGADADAVRRLLTIWTDDIDRLMSGRGTLADLEPELAATTASITITVGVGPRVAQVTGAKPPEWLRPLPAYSIDRLDPRWSGGDLFLQICADSPTTVAHAQRRMLTNMGSLATLRWVQRGFREPFESAALPMRNLFGQVDGTVQPDVAGAESHLLWCGQDDPDWLLGGSSVVIRRISMNLDSWDRADRATREFTIGRHLSSGAPLTAPEHAPATTEADFGQNDALGFHVIDDGAHMRRARFTAAHEKILRRPYSYDDPPGPGSLSDSGLIFVAYQADPVRQFAPIQARLAEKDLLNLWTTPVGSAVFAILPGAQPGEILGRRLLRNS